MKLLVSPVVAVSLLLAPAAVAQSIDVAVLVAQLPAAPGGWGAQDIDSFQSAAMGTQVTQVAREYTSADGTVTRITFINSPAMVAASQSAGMMFRNRTMVDMMNQNSTDKTFAIVDDAGWTGWSVVDTSADTVEQTAFNEQFVVKVEINRANAETLAQFHALIDWQSLGALQPVGSE